MTKSLPTLVFLASFFCASTAQDPCTNYAEIPHLDQRDKNFQNRGSFLNDALTKPGWYGTKGQDSRILLDSPPGFQRCGTLFPIWRKSSENGESAMCIQTFQNDCQYTFKIKTRMCGAREIYEFKRPDVYRSAYCFGYATKDKPPVFDVKPVVDAQLVHTGDFTSELKFSCSFSKHHEDVFYSTNWKVDDKLILTTEPMKWNGGDVIAKQALTEDQLRTANVKTYGIQVACSVRASYGLGKRSSAPIWSDGKFIGIKVSPTSVVLKQGESTDVWVQMTAPFGCGTMTKELGSACSIFVEVLTVDNPEKCEPAALVGSTCGVDITAAAWNEKIPVKVFGKITDMYGSQQTIMNIKLRTSKVIPSHTMWSSYDLGLIKVQLVKDTSLIQTKSCHSVNDPHLKTFDGRNYEHQYAGVFTMYRHNKLPVEVQIQTEKCSPNSQVNAFCNCGVVVRAGRTVFEFNRCGGQLDIWTLEYTLCEDGGDVLQVKKKGTDYEVFLPTGGKVKVTVGSRFLNVYIYPSVRDVKNSSGLCGYLSGACNDDFVQRDGNYSSDPTARGNCGERSKVWENILENFSESWRVPNGDNLFDYNNHHKLSRWPKQNTFCLCPKDSTVTKPVNQVECKASEAYETCQAQNGFTDVLPTKCSIRGRRTRPDNAGKGGNYGNSGHECSGEMCNFPAITQRPAEQQLVAGFWRNGWTEQRAREYCEDLFQTSLTVQVCTQIEGVATNESMDTCMADIWLTGSTMFSDYSVDAVRSKCLQEINVNPKYNLMAPHIVSRVCPRDCSGKGRCIRGQCRCFTNYGGADCSVNKTNPAIVTEVGRRGHCDTSRDRCDTVSVYGGTFTDDAKCHVFGYKVTRARAIYQGMKTSPALVHSIGHVTCNITTHYPNPLPVNRTNTEGLISEESVWAYIIQISNDGTARDTGGTALVVYDGTCVSATVAGLYFNWRTKGQYFVNEGKCERWQLEKDLLQVGRFTKE